MFKIISTSSLILKTHFKFSTVPSWATCDPYVLSGKNQHVVQNLVNGQWKNTSQHQDIIDPLNGEKFMKTPLITEEELQEFVQSAQQCPKSGLHNVFKNPEKFVMWGDICFKIAAEMRKKEVEAYYTKLIQRVCPKSYAQCNAEVVVTRKFFENFVGDNTRYVFEATQVSGDHPGQRNTSYRWPFGKVLVISPFNFPLEIPGLQVFAALLAGNRPSLKCDQKMTVVMEQFLRMAIHLGMPIGDVDLINCSIPHTEDLVNKSQFRLIQFTGSSGVAEKLCKMTNGKVKIEDAGFDWKILGPDVAEVEYVSWQSDQDAYASTGQKCSAQSICYVHKNWTKAGFLENIKKLAQRRNLAELTVGPVITWNNKQIQKHVDNCLKIPGAKILFGGKQLKNHTIPEAFGSYEPTAIYVPIEQISKHFEVVTTEVFGPFQIITEYDSNQVDLMLEHLERQTNHLTAAIVSNDVTFIENILSKTVNGTTYAGIRARTTGAPQNHFFGPSGDPRGAAIGTKEAIKMVWTHQREVILDYGPIAKGWKTPKET